ncbi:delta-class carbonic anhydrase [Marinomonas posidonica]|uniref:Cadmium carbonic anhydrase n=1 Tax=Marinomonas posidonica (strain CECT 7376 / NCIMB 14433 / IVIA-Po-181) TaxID=491952 RepID=F6CSW6_MARPP|nr:delta-class carbonic anhydrase [Marinomonas posidonica]AEF53956.1 hypothetical protein Mar181_0906 [Marinomonas posidonica IVIA-Po-181]
MNKKVISLILASVIAPTSVFADEHTVSQDVIAKQRQELAENTFAKGFGPQAPRDIDAHYGSNKRTFSTAPKYQKMNLCNIHFHKNAEHKGGQFTTFAGAGDGHGYNSGYKYDGVLTKAELKPAGDICNSKHGGLDSGDTIEVHYVFSTADVEPGPTLGSCLSPDVINNPQLRVESQVFVAVNDENAQDFMALVAHEKQNGLYQATSIPSDTGNPVEYAGSTTGPGYNEKGSPFQVTWNVRPLVSKVNIKTVGEWCKGNIFKEDHAHGVRNLITNPELLSQIP